MFGIIRAHEVRAVGPFKRGDVAREGIRFACGRRTTLGFARIALRDGDVRAAAPHAGETRCRIPFAERHVDRGLLVRTAARHAEARLEPDAPAGVLLGPPSGSRSLSSTISGVTVAEVAARAENGRGVGRHEGTGGAGLPYVGGQIELAQLASSLRREGIGAAAEQQHRLWIVLGASAGVLIS